MIIEPMTPSQIEWIKNLLRTFFETKIIPMASDLDIQTATFIAIKDLHPHLVPSPDDLLTAARESPVLRENVQKRYRAVLEKLLEGLSATTFQAELEKFLQESNANDVVQ